MTASSSRAGTSSTRRPATTSAREQSHGADLAKRVSAQIDSMRDEELRLLDERDRQMTLSAGATQRTLLYGSATGTALVALFYGSLVFENRRRLRAQESLAQTNALFDAVMNGTTDVIAVKDTAGRYLLINPAGCRNLGRTREDILGKTDLDVLTSGSGASVMANDAEVLRGGETRTYEQVASVGDRTWTFLSTKAPYKGPEGNVLGIIAVSRDISERKGLEDRDRAAERRARREHQATAAPLRGARSAERDGEAPAVDLRGHRRSTTSLATSRRGSSGAREASASPRRRAPGSTRSRTGAPGKPRPRFSPRTAGPCARGVPTPATRAALRVGTSRRSADRPSARRSSREARRSVSCSSTESRRRVRASSSSARSPSSSRWRSPTCSSGRRCARRPSAIRSRTSSIAGTWTRRSCGSSRA